MSGGDTSNAWRGDPGRDPRGFGKPPIYGPGSIQGATMYTPTGKITNKDIPVSIDDVYEEDPSKYRIAGMNKGGILSTKKVQQMVA